VKGETNMSTKTTTKTTTTKKEPQMATKEASPLDSMIPPAFYYDEYVSRQVGGIDDMTLLETAHNLKHNVLLSGPTGSAKTTLVYAYAHKMGMPVVNVACNGGIDVRQLIGGWQPTTDGSFQFVPGDLVLGIQHGAVILLNEVNFMPPKIAAVIYGLLDRRRTIYLPDAAGSDFPTMVKAHPRTFIVADNNPGYQGTRPLNKAFKNRFAFKLEWGYEHSVEEQLVQSPALLKVVEDLRKRAEVGDLDTPISTNMMMEFEELSLDENLGLDYAIINFVSAFEPDERNAVQEVFTLNRSLIESELFGEDEAE